VKPQKGLSNYYLVTFGQNLRTARQKASSAIEERAVGRTQILDHVYIVSKNDPRMSA
jgi:hypothetical protein